MELPKQWGFIFLVLVLLAGIALRSFPLASRSLEYDEIWTLLNYASGPLSKLTSDLTTPNNHVFHSLCVWGSIRAFGDCALAVRLPAFLASCGTLLLVALFGLKRRPFPVALMITAWVAFYPDFIHYGRTARGYSLQIFLLLLYAIGCLQLLHSPKNSRWTFFYVLMAGCLSVFTLPTSILFLVPFAAFQGVLLFAKWGRKNEWRLGWRAHRRTLVAHAIVLLVSTAWILWNKDQFAQGQQHGLSIASWTSFSRWMMGVLTELSLLPLLGLSLIGLFFEGSRKSALFAWALVLFVGCTLPWVQAGPSRVYLYLVPFFMIAVAEGLYSLSSFTRRWEMVERLEWIGLALALLLALVPLYGLNRRMKMLEPRDWPQAVDSLEKKMPSRTYIVYPVYETLPIKYYHYPEINRRVFYRVPYANAYHLALAGNCLLSGADRERWGGVEFPIPDDLPRFRLEIADIPIHIFSLRRILPGDPIFHREKWEGTWIASVGPGHPRDVLSLTKKFDFSWIVLNPFLMGPLLEKDGEFVCAYVLAAQNPSAGGLEEWLKKNGEFVRLYKFGE